MREYFIPHKTGAPAMNATIVLCLIGIAAGLTSGFFGIAAGLLLFRHLFISLGSHK